MAAGTAWNIYYWRSLIIQRRKIKEINQKREQIINKINSHLRNSADYRHHYIETGDAPYLWYAMEENGKAKQLIEKYERL